MGLKTDWGTRETQVQAGDYFTDILHCWNMLRNCKKKKKYFSQTHSQRQAIRSRGLPLELRDHTDWVTKNQEQNVLHHCDMEEVGKSQHSTQCWPSDQSNRCREKHLYVTVRCDREPNDSFGWAPGIQCTAHHQPQLYGRVQTEALLREETPGRWTWSLQNDSLLLLTTASKFTSCLEETRQLILLCPLSSLCWGALGMSVWGGGSAAGKQLLLLKDLNMSMQ